MISLRYYMNHFGWLLCWELMVPAGQGKKVRRSTRMTSVSSRMLWEVDGSSQSGSRGGSKPWICSEGNANSISWQNGCHVWEKERNQDGSSFLSLSQWEARFAFHWAVEGCRKNTWRKGIPNWTCYICKAQMEMLSELLGKRSCSLKQRPQLQMDIWGSLKM